MSKDNRNATQKIEDMENALMALYQAADATARDLATVKDAIKMLGNKLDSVVKAITKQEPLTDEVLSRIMIENNCEQLANNVRTMVAQGTLVAATQVATDSYLVGAEQNDLGETINPRLQFALFAIKPVELQQKFIGAMVGDLISVGENRPKFKILEVYQIQAPAQQEQPAADAAPTESPAETAPAAEAAPTA